MQIEDWRSHGTSFWEFFYWLYRIIQLLQVSLWPSMFGLMLLLHESLRDVQESGTLQNPANTERHAALRSSHGVVPMAVSLLTIGFALLVVSVLALIAVGMLLGVQNPGKHADDFLFIFAAAAVTAMWGPFLSGGFSLLGTLLCTMAPARFRAGPRAVLATAGMILFAGLITLAVWQDTGGIPFLVNTTFCVSITLIAMLLSRLARSAGDLSISRSALLFVTILPPLDAAVFNLYQPSEIQRSLSPLQAFAGIIEAIILLILLIWYGWFLLRIRAAYRA